MDSLDQFVRELYPQAPSFEKRRLVARCFRVATQQGWVLPSGRAVAVYLVQFGTRLDARSYALAVQSADLADPRNKLHGAVRGVSDGILIEAPKLDKYGNTLSRMIGDKGNVAMIIHIFVPAHLPSRTSAVPLLRRQAARAVTYGCKCSLRRWQAGRSGRSACAEPGLAVGQFPGDVQ